MEDDHLSFDKTIRAMQNQTKINIGEILDKYKISPKWKARMDVPLCRMVPMPIMRHDLKIDILKIKHAFHMRYTERDMVFYLSLTNWKGEEQDVSLHSGTWDEHWVVENEQFEKVLKKDPNLVCLSSKTFFVWDKNHRIQAWMPYISKLHNDDPF
jgi:hypothetical protein